MDEKERRLMEMLEAGKPQFPLGTVVVGLIGASVGLALIIWDIMMR